MERNEQRRKRRIYNKIYKALNNHYRCLFLTITFNDKTLKRTSEKTRERYIKNYLNNETAFYIVNKDFGTDKRREHYHAFIVPTTLRKADFKNYERDLETIKNQINLTAWKYGNIQAHFIATRFVIKGDKNYKKTSEFLTNHFYKETAKNSRIIQSRKEPTKKEQKERIERLYQAKIKNQIKNLKNAIDSDLYF